MKTEKMSLEDLLINNIENGIRGIRLGTKKPNEVKVGYNLNRLSKINEGMFEDYLNKYKNVLRDYNNKNTNIIVSK